MSTAVDARRRPNIWSYISFGSPRRRSISLPKPNGHSVENKDDAFRRKIWDDGHARNVSGSYRDASMTGGQRSRLLKTGGLIVAVFFLFYLLSSRDSAGVRDLVKGLLQSPSVL